jgi:hypothetical protein
MRARSFVSAATYIVLGAHNGAPQSSGRGDVNKLKELRVKAVRDNLIEVSGKSLSCLATLIAASAGLTAV